MEAWASLLNGTKSAKEVLRWTKQDDRKNPQAFLSAVHHAVPAMLGDIETNMDETLPFLAQGYVSKQFMEEPLPVHRTSRRRSSSRGGKGKTYQSDFPPLGKPGKKKKPQRRHVQPIAVVATPSIQSPGLSPFQTATMVPPGENILRTEREELSDMRKRWPVRAWGSSPPPIPIDGEKAHDWVHLVDTKVDVDRRRVLYDAAHVHARLILDRRVPHVGRELCTLARMLGVTMEEGGIQQKGSFANGCEVAWYAVAVWNHLRPLIPNLGQRVVRLLVECSVIQAMNKDLFVYVSDVQRRLSQRPMSRNVPRAVGQDVHGDESILHKLLFPDETPGPKQSRLDHRKEDVRHRFLEMQRLWRPMDSTNEFARSVRGVLSKVASEAGCMPWFAGLFAERLLIAGDEDRRDAEVLRMAAAGDPGRLSSLRQRLGGNDFAPRLFPERQSFFAAFLQIADSHALTHHLLRRLTATMIGLSKDTVNHSSLLSPDDVVERCTHLRVMGRMVGWLLFSPHWQSSIGDADYSALAPGGLLWLLQSARTEKHLSLALPWVSELLYMAKEDVASMKGPFCTELIQELTAAASSLQLNRCDDRGYGDRLGTVMVILELERLLAFLGLPPGGGQQEDWHGGQVQVVSMSGEEEDVWGLADEPTTMSPVLTPPSGSVAKPWGGLIPPSPALPLSGTMMDDTVDFFSTRFLIAHCADVRELMSVLAFAGTMPRQPSGPRPQPLPVQPKASVRRVQPVLQHKSHLPPLAPVSDMLRGEFFKGHPDVRSVVDFVLRRIISNAQEVALTKSLPGIADHDVDVVGNAVRVLATKRELHGRSDGRFLGVVDEAITAAVETAGEDCGHIAVRLALHHCDDVLETLLRGLIPVTISDKQSPAEREEMVRMACESGMEVATAIITDHVPNEAKKRTEERLRQRVRRRLRQDPMWPWSEHKDTRPVSPIRESVSQVFHNEESVSHQQRLFVKLRAGDYEFVLNALEKSPKIEMAQVIGQCWSVMKEEKWKKRLERICEGLEDIVVV